MQIAIDLRRTRSYDDPDTLPAEAMMNNPASQIELTPLHGVPSPLPAVTPAGLKQLCPSN